MTLSTDQKQAASNFLKFIADPEATEMAIQGHAGTGKTFLTKHLIRLMRSSKKLARILTENSNSFDKDIQYTASTNKAANVLSEMVGEPTTTIHSLLGITVFDDYKTGKTSIKQSPKFTPLYNVLVIIDEASMINTEILKIIRNSCYKCKILYILDPYQLAPVGESTCAIPREVSNTTILTTIHRQAANNPIIGLAEKFRQTLAGGSFPQILDNGKEIRRVSPNEWRGMVETAFTDKAHTIDSSKILAYTNKAVQNANKFVRALHTSSEHFEVGEHVVTNKPILGMRGNIAYSTDSIFKITAVQHEPEIMLGILTQILHIKNITLYSPVNPNELKTAKTQLNKENNAIKKQGGRPNFSKYFEMKNTFADLRSVHASTVHKSQGSTYDTVFINLSDIGSHFNATEVARLMYVAITRAAKRIVLVGNLGRKYGD